MRSAERKLRALIGPNDGVAVRPLIDQAIAGAVAEAPAEERDELEAEFELLKAELGDFAFAATKPYWSQKEKKAPGSGGLFSITVNPLTCKACALCVEVCEDDALKMVDPDRGVGRHDCAATGVSGSTCRRRPRNSAASTASTRRSARWRRCCSTRAITTR